MKHFRPLIVFVLLLVPLSLVYAAGQDREQACLALRDSRGNTLFSSQLADGSQFAIRYIHSVALSPVRDYFIIKNNRIFLDKTVYKDFGAGLPTFPEKGQTMRAQNGKVIIEGFNRDVTGFALRVGRIANHTLLLFPEKEGEAMLEMPLSSLSPAGGALIFSVSEGICQGRQNSMDARGSSPPARQPDN